MNPFEIRLIIAAIALAAAAAGGWTLEHWRTGAEIEHLKAERDRAVGQGNVLAASVAACSAAVDQGKKLGDQAVAQIRGHLAEMRKHDAGNEAAIAGIEALIAGVEPAGASCESAWQAIEAQRKSRAP